VARPIAARRLTAPAKPPAKPALNM
jgi:hypothetical protein